MRLKQLVVVVAIAMALVGCGNTDETSSSNSQGPSIAVGNGDSDNRVTISATQSDGLPYTVEVKLGNVTKPSRTATLTDMTGAQTTSLGNAKCATSIDWAGDDAREITVSVKGTGQGKILLSTNLEVRDPAGASTSNQGVTVVWLGQQGFSDCSGNGESIHDPQLGGDTNMPFPLKQSGFLIFHGGAEQFKNYTLRVTVEGGPYSETDRPSKTAKVKLT